GEGNMPYTGSFHVDHLGPKVIAQVPSGDTDGPLDHITFTFNEGMDGSFVNDNFSGTDVVTSFTLTYLDSNGNPVTQDVSSRLSWVSDALPDHTQFTIYFYPNPAALGTYTMVLGPHIKDLAGNEMNQDGDTINGEPEDAYTATFNIVRAPDLVVTSV